jgi:hypothetical protein
MKHDSVVCNMSNGARFDDGKGGHCCPLHNAASDLLAAAKIALTALNVHDRMAEYAWHKRQIKKLEAAIAKAQGGTK